jgi:hypothetical protein
MQKQIALVTTGAVSMQIEHHIPHELLFVEGEIEADIDCLGCKSFAVSGVGFDHLRVVGESGRSD